LSNIINEFVNDIHKETITNTSYKQDKVAVRQPSDPQPACTGSPPVGCCRQHPPSPFIVITHSESWHSFHCPTEDERPRCPRQCSFRL